MWRSQDDVAMDAATRLTSTPLGQVANPSFIAFFSEYFLMPDEIARLYLATDAFWMVYLFIFFFFYYKTAPFIPKKKLSLKLQLATAFGWNFEKRVYVTIEPILPGDGGHDSLAGACSEARWRLLGSSDVGRWLPLATGPGSWVGAV